MLTQSVWHSSLNEPQTDASLFGLAGLGTGSFSKTFYGSIHCSVFIFNLLYLGLTSKTLALFNCKATGNGDWYMVTNPSITCFEGDHLILMILGIIPLLCYTIAWPLVIMVAFYNATRRHLFHDKDFKGIFGFIYMVTPHTDYRNDCG